MIVEIDMIVGAQTTARMAHHRSAATRPSFARELACVRSLGGQRGGAALGWDSASVASAGDWGRSW